MHFHFLDDFPFGFYFYFVIHRCKIYVVAAAYKTLVIMFSPSTTTTIIIIRLKKMSIQKVLNGNPYVYTFSSCVNSSCHSKRTKNENNLHHIAPRQVSNSSASKILITETASFLFTSFHFLLNIQRSL